MLKIFMIDIKQLLITNHWMNIQGILYFEERIENRLHLIAQTILIYISIH